MWLGGSYFLSLYLFFSQPFMCLMHSDCGVRHLLGSGTVSPTHTWQFCKKRSALSHLDLMSVTQKWAVLKKKYIKCISHSLLWWNKPTGPSEFLSFMWQIDAIILQHLQFRETCFLFCSQWHRNLLGYHSHKLCCTLVWARKCLMTATSVLSMWLREKHRNAWRDHSKQAISYALETGAGEKWERWVPAQLSKTPCRWWKIRN